MGEDPVLGVVAVIDALGTSQMVGRSEPRTFAAERAKLIADLKLLLETGYAPAEAMAMSKWGGSHTRPDTSVIAFSDSLIVTAPVPSSDPKALGWYLGMVGFRLANVLARALSGSGVMFRGAITTGDFWAAQQVLAGPAIREAKNYADIADWAGVVLGPSCELPWYEVARTRPNWFDSRFVRYPVPLRSGGELDLYALNWPKYLEGEASRRPFRTIMEAFLPSSPDPDAFRKYRNTMEFAHSCLRDRMTSGEGKKSPLARDWEAANAFPL